MMMTMMMMMMMVNKFLVSKWSHQAKLENLGSFPLDSRTRCPSWILAGADNISPLVIFWDSLTDSPEKVKYIEHCLFCFNGKSTLSDTPLSVRPIQNCFFWNPRDLISRTIASFSSGESISTSWPVTSCHKLSISNSRPPDSSHRLSLSNQFMGASANLKIVSLLTIKPDKTYI